MFRTMSLLSAGSNRRGGGSASKAWLRRTATLITATMVGTTAMTGIAAAAPAMPETPTLAGETISYLTFDDVENPLFNSEGENWWPNGDPKLQVVPEYYTLTYIDETIQVPVVDEDGLAVLDEEGQPVLEDQIVQVPGNPTPSDNLVLSIEQNGENWFSIQAPGAVLQPGYTYLMTVAARLADGVEGENQVAFNSCLGGGQSCVWVENRGTAVTSDAWKYHTVEMTIPADAEARHVFIGTQTATDFLIDNVLITRSAIETTDPGEGGNGGGEVAAPEFPALVDGERVVATSDFTTEGWSHDFQTFVAREFNADAGAWQFGRATWGGIFDANSGEHHFPMVEGDTYRFEVAVRAADAVSDGVRVNLVYSDGNSVNEPLGNTNLAADNWTILSGTVTAQAGGQDANGNIVGMRLRAAAGADVQVLVHSARLVRIADDNGNGGGETTPPSEPNRVLSVTQDDDWQGLQIPGSMFEGGKEYRVQARVLDGDTGEAARFVTQTDENDFAWVGNTLMNTEAWAQINATFTARSTGLDHLRLVAGVRDAGVAAPGTFYIDDVVITDVATGDVVYRNDFQTEGDTSFGGDGGEFANVIDPLEDEGTQPPAQGGWEDLAVLDFEDGTIVNSNNQIVGGGNTWPTAGGSAYTLVADPADADNTVLSFAQTANWQGLQTPAGILENGVQYRISADVRWAEGGSGNIRLVSSDDGGNPFGWVANTDATDSAWTRISGTFTPDEFGNPIIRVNGGLSTDGSANNPGTILVDNVRLEQYVTDGVVTPPPTPFTPVVVWETEFADGDSSWMTNLEGAGAAIGVIANPDGDGNVLNVTGRSAEEDQEWRGARIVEVLEPGVEYRVELTARLVGTETGAVQFRGMPGFGWINNSDITNEWTTVTSANWMAGANPAINLGVAPNGAEYQISSIKLWQLTAPIVVDPDWEFDGKVWDFEDGTNQSWFARDNNGTLAVVEGGAPALVAEATEDALEIWKDTDFALRISDRTNQGNGPMIDVVDILAPMQRFAVSGWARFVDREDGDGGVLTLSVQHGASNFTNLLTNIRVQNNEWTYFEGEITMPAFTTMANLYFETPHNGTDTSTFEIDQFSIQMPDPIEWEQNLIPLSATLPGINTGVAVDSRELTGEHAKVIQHHFSKLVAENHMKPENWYAGNGFNTFRMHSETRAILDFAEANDLDVFGHVLLWHSQTPSWFFSRDGVNPVSADNPELTNSPADQEIMLGRMRTYIRQVAEAISDEYGPFGTPGNPINSYEVANEVVAGSLSAGLNSGGLRADSPWTRIFFVPGQPTSGYRFIEEGFRYADQVFNGEFHYLGTQNEDGTWNTAQGDPRITLWVNDYNTERGGIGTPNSPGTKRVQLLNLVNFLVERGAPIDGVGHQFHAGLEWPVAGLRDALELFARDNDYLSEFPVGHPRYGKGLLQAVTEIDVTIDGPLADVGSEVNLIRQGDYYMQAFDIIRNFQKRTGEIDTVTIWGLTDGRSWRYDRLPLLFDDALMSKPAFHGAVLNHDILTDGYVPNPPEGGWVSPPLQPVVMEANVFGATIELSDATFDGVVWNQLPGHSLAQNAGEFHLRWQPGTLTVLGDLNGLMSTASTPAQPFSAQITLDGRVLVIHQDGSVTETAVDGPIVDDVEAITQIGDDGWKFIVQIPVDASVNSNSALNVARRDNVRDNLGAWSSSATGQITFVTPLGFVEIPQANSIPTIDVAGMNSTAWDNAASVRADNIIVNNNVVGVATEGAADVKAVWGQGTDFATLYLLVDVNDSTPDVSSAEAHLQDSVEIFVGLIPNRGGVTEWMDAQFRVSRAGDVTFGQSNNWSHPLRINRYVQDNGTGGYQAIISIDMRTGGGHQVGAWDELVGSGLGFFHNFDVQVNDATPAGRIVISWAGNDTGFGSTARLGIMQFVDNIGTGPVLPPVPPAPPAPPVVTPPVAPPVEPPVTLPPVVEDEPLVIDDIPAGVTYVALEFTVNAPVNGFVAMFRSLFRVAPTTFWVIAPVVDGQAVFQLSDILAAAAAQGVVIADTASLTFRAFAANDAVTIPDVEEEVPFLQGEVTVAPEAPAPVTPVVPVVPAPEQPETVTPEVPVVPSPVTPAPVTPQVPPAPGPATPTPVTPVVPARPAQPAPPAQQDETEEPAAEEEAAEETPVAEYPSYVNGEEPEAEVEYEGPGYAVDADEYEPGVAGVNPLAIVIPLVIVSGAGLVLVVLRRRGLA